MRHLSSPYTITKRAELIFERVCMKKLSCKDTCCHQCMRSAETCAELDNSLGRCNQEFGNPHCKKAQRSGAECPAFVKQE
jgi:hypothetical protein